MKVPAVKVVDCDGWLLENGWDFRLYVYHNGLLVGDIFLTFDMPAIALNEWLIMLGVPAEVRLLTFEWLWSA